MDFRESSEHRDLRATVRAITAEFGPGYYVPRAEAGEPTSELWTRLGAGGFLGINLPEEYGGGGAGLAELAIVCEETAAAGCPQLLLLVSAAISGEMITGFGTEEQKRHFLPRMASGESKVVFAITEPDAGSNTHKLSTVAKRDGSDWIVNGAKYYISGVDEAEAILLVARTGIDETSGRARLSLFLVPTDTPGLEKTPLPVSAKLPEKQFTLHFDDMRLPGSALLGAQDEGFHQVFHGLNPERITGAAVCVGVARHVLAQASAYATTRTVWDAPIAAHQGVSHPLAKARIETDLAALMTSKAAWLHDEDLPAGEASNMAKYAAAEAAGAAVEAAIQTHGGNGLATEYGLLPYWGIARLLRIAPVSREMVLNFVAQHSLGLTRSY
ncbi:MULTISPECIES: acyl-CoA dehydrogenase family protein [Pseudonocardia]|uniref:Acyl-CoA dehydrogenase fadE12 n=2 Tax=Pseudonocardia TaxID=1847 RepID=A0A1Y2N5H2_PSEAH|nr:MULTISPECIES: acyl-CoA dehydrogenase family protein [Pseudonocardia]OSY42723.1 Acyl-CoA dehydrogenase fadE12 [Pseudonocardia autotrophica]TDN77300.1 alkylation response protein AidB-like acyl-CoA dehydrogenase [Pseudonocardia autotrophica]BBG01321.1 acyl-CoA dehydrogenase [Pseudonocardia autotrophica]GEC24377.1 acyl-CoA dehydrogenase [Pseudonocardia saturnea]